MSDDIVARLRQIPTAWPLVREAADEIERLRRNTGCARDQRSTQFCREALDAQREVVTLTDEIELLRSTVTDCRIEIERITAERDEARREVCGIRDSIGDQT